MSFAPSGITTDAGTERTAGFEDANVTTAPPGSAGPVSTALTKLVDPPGTVVGAAVKLVNAGGDTVTTCVAVPVACAAVMITSIELLTTEVEIVKAALFTPAATRTLAGTVAAGLAELRLIIMPPAGAGPVR